MSSDSNLDTINNPVFFSLRVLEGINLNKPRLQLHHHSINAVFEKIKVLYVEKNQ